MGEQAIHPNSNMNTNGKEDSNEENDDHMEVSEEEEEDLNLSEISDLNRVIDEVNSALDTMEQKNNSIHDELLKLLKSSKEVRQQMSEQNTQENSTSDN